MPGVTATATAVPLPSLGSIHTCLTCAVLAPAADDFRVLLRGLFGTRLAAIPFLAGWPAAAVVGEKRSAALGTSSTSLRLVAMIVAVAVMPGRRLRSALLTAR